MRREMDATIKLAYNDGRFEDAKRLKLEAYANKPITGFVQFDGFANVSGDSVTHPDEDGDAAMAAETHELMSGVSEVRVLIRHDVSKEDALRLLEKLTHFIETDFEDFRFRHFTELGRKKEDAEFRAPLERGELF
jgi:hypothetical protein